MQKKHKSLKLQCSWKILVRVFKKMSIEVKLAESLDIEIVMPKIDMPVYGKQPDSHTYLWGPLPFVSRHTTF